MAKKLDDSVSRILVCESSSDDDAFSKSSYSLFFECQIVYGMPLGHMIPTINTIGIICPKIFWAPVVQ